MTVIDTNSLQTRPGSESIIVTLRTLMPDTQLSLEERLSYAERQATRLWRITRTETLAFPHKAITSLPEIRITHHLLPKTIHGQVYVDDNNWIIVLNGHDSAYEQRFAVAHEFKHILDSTKENFIYNGLPLVTAIRQSETTAERFATCLLVPKRQLQQLVNHGIDQPEKLSDYFQAPQSAVTHRMEQLGLIQYRDEGIETVKTIPVGKILRLSPEAEP